MAILKKQEDNENTQGGGQPSPFLPSTSMPPGSTQAYTAPKKPSAGSGSGRFTNIQSYLQAAQPEKAGQETGGQQIQSGVQKAQEKNAASIREGIAKSQEQFGNVYNPENSRLSAATPFVQNTLSAAQTNPSQLTEDQINQFRGLATGKGDYNILKGLTGTPDASGLQDAAQMAGSEAGRYQLLKDTFKRPTYSSGQQKLDQLLLQTQSAAPLQKNLSELANTVGGERSRAMTEAEVQAKTLSDLAKGASTAANTGVSGAETALEKDLTGRATGLQTSADSAYGAFNKALSGQTLNPQESAAALKYAKDTGLDLNQGLYGIPGYQDFHPDQYLTHQQFNVQNIASTEERARADALAKLAGVENTFLPGQAPTDHPALENVFNRAGFKEATDKRKTEYESQYNPRKTELDSINAVRDAWSNPDLQNLRNVIAQNAGNLDPNLVNELLSTKELSGMGASPGVIPVPNLTGPIPGAPDMSGGGMHGEKRYLGDVFKLYGDPRRDLLTSETDKLNKDYSAGQTLESLLKSGYRK